MSLNEACRYTERESDGIPAGTVKRWWFEVSGKVKERFKNEPVDLAKQYDLEFTENRRERDGTFSKEFSGNPLGRPPKYESKPEYFKSHSTGENEWYTPVEYILAASGRIGEIDLDPAGIIEAQLQANAARYFTKSDKALVRSWTGRVWLNPPYAQPHFLDSFKSWFLS